MNKSPLAIFPTCASFPMEYPGTRTTLAPAVVPTLPPPALHSALSMPITLAALSQPLTAFIHLFGMCMPRRQCQLCCILDMTFQTGQGPTPSQGIFPSTPKLSQHYLPCLKKGDRIPSLDNHREQTEGTQLWLSMLLCQSFFQTCGIFCGCPLNSVHLHPRLLVLSHHACSESPNSKHTLHHYVSTSFYYSNIPISS